LLIFATDFLLPLIISAISPFAIFLLTHRHDYFALRHLMPFLSFFEESLPCAIDADFSLPRLPLSHMPSTFLCRALCRSAALFQRHTSGRARMRRTRRYVAAAGEEGVARAICGAVF